MRGQGDVRIGLGSEEMEKEAKGEIEGSEVMEMERGCKKYVCKKGGSKTCLLKQPCVSFCA